MHQIMLPRGTSQLASACTRQRCQNLWRPVRHIVAPTCSASGATSSQQGLAVTGPATFHHGIIYTNYEVNTFTIKFNTTGCRVLVDPWFVDDLVFADQTWMYTGKKRVIGRSIKVDMEKIASETDVLIITQGLDDHCHMPTLRQFPKHVPVIAQPEAAARIKPLGFKDVRILDHNQTLDVVDGKLKITGTVGALVGPPWSKRQIGLLFREQITDNASRPATSLYYEAHCDFDARSVAKLGQVDIVVSPVKTALIGPGPAVYPITMGDINLKQLVKLLKPKVLIPLLNNEIEHVGAIAPLLRDRGDYNQIEAQLESVGMGHVRVEFPAPPGEAMAIAL